MRVTSAYLLGVLAALLGSVAAVWIPALAAGRLDIFYKRRTYFVWTVKQGGKGATVWLVVAALARAIGAFGAARIVFALLRVPPPLAFAAGLLFVLVWWDVRRIRMNRLAPIPVPSEILSTSVLRATANSVAAAALALLFVYA
jgi:hypothetical protein